MKRLYLLLLLLLLGCTHAPVHLVPGDCPTRSILGFEEDEREAAYTLEHVYWSFIGPKKILLSDLLKTQPHECADLSKVELRFSQRFSDVLIGLSPFVSRGRIFLSYGLE